MSSTFFPRIKPDFELSDQRQPQGRDIFKYLINEGGNARRLPKVGWGQQIPAARESLDRWKDLKQSVLSVP